MRINYAALDRGQQDAVCLAERDFFDNNEVLPVDTHINLVNHGISPDALEVQLEAGLVPSQFI